MNDEFGSFVFGMFAASVAWFVFLIGSFDNDLVERVSYDNPQKLTVAQMMRDGSFPCLEGEKNGACRERLIERLHQDARDYIPAMVPNP